MLLKPTRNHNEINIAADEQLPLSEKTICGLNVKQIESSRRLNTYKLKPVNGGRLFDLLSCEEV